MPINPLILIVFSHYVDNITACVKPNHVRVRDGAAFLFLCVDKDVINYAVNIFFFWSLASFSFALSPSLKVESSLIVS